MNSKKLVKDILYAFLAQGISLGLSVIMSLVIPKILNVEAYGYWQLFLFYSSYVGLFHLGLIDGIYLRLGGKSHETLDNDFWGTELKIFSLGQIIIAALVAVISLTFLDDTLRIYVLLLTALYLPVTNIMNYLGYIFQATNRTKLYSIATIIDRVAAIAFIAFLIIRREEDVWVYIILYVVSRSIALLYCCVQSKELVLGWKKPDLALWQDIKLNISVGIKLMISNLISMLVLGIGRMFIDLIWGIETFGKFSMSISLINFTLQFIAQVSMVLFPALRTVTKDKLQEIYRVVQPNIGIVLSGVLIVFFPIKLFIYYWLPDYYDSIAYLALLMPICLFDGKMSIVCTTYFKVLREERLLLAINVGTMVVSAALSAIGGFILGNVFFIIGGMVLTIALRCAVSELLLSRIMRQKAGINTLLECLLAVIFMYCSYFLSVPVGGGIYLALFLLYAGLNHKSLMAAARFRL